MNFASDNSGPAFPAIIQEIAAVNKGYEPSYGAESTMSEVLERIQLLFEAPKASVYLVATGTAANALSLACISDPWSTIFCHRHSHAEEDECGAPEFYTGGSKLTLVDGQHGKMSPLSLESVVSSTGLLGVHNVQPGALTITNATEKGTVYSPDELAELTSIASQYGIKCHLDGARFANALVANDCSPASLSWKSGVDILTLGGTKNGLLGVEAVVIFDPSLAWEFELRRKRGGHLFSKHRYLSAQLNAYLRNGLWLDLAKRSNRAATKLGQGLASIREVELLHPVEANIVFASIPLCKHRAALEAGATYYVFPANQSQEGNDNDPISVRLVCNWASEDEEIENLIRILS